MVADVEDSQYRRIREQKRIESVSSIIMGKRKCDSAILQTVLFSPH